MFFTDAKQIKEVFEQVYSDIYRNRFGDLPIANHLLSVQVVGLRETPEVYTFCLVTPWMVNKIVIPKKEDITNPVFDDMRLDKLEQLGEFYVANVISPMDRFQNMEEAVEAAEKYAQEIFSQASGEGTGQQKELTRRDFFKKMHSPN